ncbi:hypothetical protein, partial [Bacillus sp. mrc49]|uniref:hypothetical protein n=1 Tax=Bacillus sp. mrc49 TaxID=2054913 RepID=UPI000CBC30AC
TGKLELAPIHRQISGQKPKDVKRYAINHLKVFSESHARCMNKVKLPQMTVKHKYVLHSFYNSTRNHF